MNETPAQKIKRLRKALHMTRAELAVAMNISRAWVASIEQGRRQPPFWLAELMGCRLNERRRTARAKGKAKRRREADELNA